MDGCGLVTAMTTRAWRSSAVRTALLSGVLIGLAVAISAVWLRRDGAGDLVGQPAIAVLLAVAFFLAEQNLVTFEFRRQSHSMTFAGVPLALGILLLPAPALVLARVLGSVCAFVRQRTSAEKLTYNLAAFAFEAAAGASLAALLVADDLDSLAVLTLIGCIAAVDQLMTALVMLVIRIHGIAMGRRDVVQIVVQSAVLSVVVTVFAVALRILMQRGVTGDCIAVVLVGVSTVGYRMYAGTVRRHHAVTTVHEFMTEDTISTSPAELTAARLAKIRAMLRASSAEVTLVDDGSSTDRWTVYTIDEDDRVRVTTADPARSDWVRLRALSNAIATLAVRGRDPLIDEWLDTAGPDGTRLDDAIVVPVHHAAVQLGTLTVTGRLTEVAEFTDDDLTVLQTLAGHFAASLMNARLVETLSYEATHDALTGLANRSQLIGELAAVGDEAAALLVVDIDRFNDVNDVLGHRIADEVLVYVAKRLHTLLPEATTLARVGGDEFAVLLRGEHAGGDLVAQAASLSAALSQPLQLRGVTVAVSVSTSVASTADVPARELLRSADTAMATAKARADRVAAYSPAMDIGRAERVALAADLRIALEHAPEQFVIHLQPKVDLQSGRAVGAEALVRWQHPTHGLIAPDRFIPIAEATGLIAPLTRHVLHRALAECATWGDVGGGDIAVNLSPRLLTDLDVTEMVGDALRASTVPAHRLILEITESVIMTDADAAIATLHRIAALGVRISLDDFGTGYSSLAYLHRLPAAELKIDRSFVVAVDGTDDRTSALLRNIVSLGRDLGLRIVAEGIETTAHAEALTGMGCALGQGFLYARPLAPDAFRHWLGTNRRSVLQLLPSA